MKRGLRLLGLSTAVALGLLTSGCSFLFTKKPPSEVERRSAIGPVKCTTSWVAPVFDTIIGSYQVVRTGIAIDKSDEDYGDAPISREVDIGFGVGLATLFLSSAVYGFTVTDDCRELKARAASSAQPADVDSPDE